MMATFKKFSVSLVNSEGKEVYFSFATQAEAIQFCQAVRSGSNQVIKTWKWNQDAGKAELVDLDNQPDLAVKVLWQAPDGSNGDREMPTIGEAEDAVRRAIGKGFKAYYTVGGKAFMPADVKPVKPTPAAFPAPVEQKAATAPAAPKQPMEVHIWTDGSCKGNGKAENRGGWAAVLVCGEHQKEISGGVANTTNNRMELQAVVEGLKALKFKAEVTIHSDSAYFSNAIEKGWLKKWRSAGWINAQRKPVENRDLWEEFCALSIEKCTHLHVEKVAGHAGNPLNERCDTLAVAAASAVE